MVFSSLTFLCVFLPLTFVLVLLASRWGTAAMNGLLIVASVLFYAYGEPAYVLLMLASVLANYVFGLLVGQGARWRKVWIVVAVVANLATLAVFKYAGFMVESINALCQLQLPIPQLPLPLGISFYTFQAISYVIDVYRGDVEAQRRLSRVLLYISLFPQLVAGPIVKYHDIEEQMEHRTLTVEGAEAGLRRFACGLAKKVLLSNTLAAAVDALFAGAETLTCAGAWVAAFAYTLQIYFDFSGYSDMAIGLGKLFGFQFQENFDHPYVATSIRDFWRRWHISLSTWFKEYVYIPLGGNRKGRIRTGVNKCVVFLLCGLWHGANWTFVIWGALHGLLQIVEELTPLRRLPKALGHLYTVLFVVLAFVIFRADSIEQAVTVLSTMLTGGAASGERGQILLMAQLTPAFLTALAAGVLLSMPLGARVSALLDRGPVLASQLVRDVLAILLVFLCVVSLSSGTYNPFIYFRF